MAVFDYPELPHVRKHGPCGYRDYSSFRPWVRDEFTFRCVYCLKREQWGYVSGDYDLDHFLPQAKHPEFEDEYDNLLYSCSRCNGAKGAQLVPDPTTTLIAEQLHVLPDGMLEPLTSDAHRLVAKLDLNAPQLVTFRLMWLRIIELAEEQELDLHGQLMGFPGDLPNLAILRPRDNFRPDGVPRSYHAMRVRGELPNQY